MCSLCPKRQLLLNQAGSQLPEDAGGSFGLLCHRPDLETGLWVPCDPGRNMLTCRALSRYNLRKRESNREAYFLIILLYSPIYLVCIINEDNFHTPTFTDNRHPEWDANDTNKVFSGHQGAQDGTDSQSLSFALIN